MSVHKRRKGIAIVHTSKGILVVAGRSKKFMLPGGGAEKWETRKKAAMRELREETGLKTRKITYLFSYVGNTWHAHGGKIVQNYAKVFLVQTEGLPRPKSEIKYVDFWKPGKKLVLASGTREVIRRYLEKA